MPFIPSIQSLVGDHSGGVAIGLDWTRRRAFEVSNTNLSRYGLLTGLEEAYAPLADMGGIGENGIAAPIGIAANGNIFLSASGSLYNGAAMYVDGSALTMINLIGYPPPNEGLGGMVGFTFGSTQYAMDMGLGNSIITVLNRIQFNSTTAWLGDNNFTHVGGVGCAGMPGDGMAYLLSAPDGGPSQTGPATLSAVTFDGSGYVSNVAIGDITMASVEPTWTDQFHPIGVCLDQTDGKLLAVFAGNGGVTTHTVLAKINPATAALEWTVHLPNSDGGGRISAGVTFAYSDIKNQRCGFYTGSPPQVTIIDTSDGSVDTQYSSNLNGLSNIDGQCYNDSLGAIVLGCDFSNTTGSPTLLNSTPTSWGDGYAVLYVAAGSHKRRFLAQSRPIRIIQ